MKTTINFMKQFKNIAMVAILISSLSSCDKNGKDESNADVAIKGQQEA